MTSTSNYTYVISVLFSDRVGIVAEVSALIKQLGGNLAEISQTVMRGYFTMIAMAEFQNDIGVKSLRKAFSEAAALKGAEIGILPLNPSPAKNAKKSKRQIKSKEQSNLYVLTAAGPDQPGIVNAFSGYLRERDINIVDLSSTNINGEYTMVWLIDLPQNTDIQKLLKSLQLSTKNLKMRIGLRHHEIFKKTNEI